MKEHHTPPKTYPHAICLPCSGAENGPVVFGIKGGVCQANRTPIPEGFLYRQITQTMQKRSGLLQQNVKCEVPVTQIQLPGDIGETKHILPGPYIYAGLLFPHFGHFLLESLARLWFIKQHPSIPLLWVAAHKQTALNSLQQELFELLNVNNPVHILTEQSEIEELIVPKAGYMLSTLFTPEQKEALRVCTQAPLKPGKRVWLSRSKLKHARILNEPALERVLEAEGWLIYHPEEHSIRDQLHCIHNAEHIAGIIGSAHHLLLLTPDYQGRVSIFSRGPTVNGDFFNIAETLGLKQTIYFNATADCTPKRPSWGKDWLWLNMNSVLKSLGIRGRKNNSKQALRTLLEETPPQIWWRVLPRILLHSILNKTALRGYRNKTAKPTE